jgi:hypothetical protein
LIGDQEVPDREFLVDTIAHEEIEARILAGEDVRYRRLQNLSEDMRHERIQEIIDAGIGTDEPW